MTLLLTNGEQFDQEETTRTLSLISGTPGWTWITSMGSGPATSPTCFFTTECIGLRPRLGLVEASPAKRRPATVQRPGLIGDKRNGEKRNRLAAQGVFLNFTMRWTDEMLEAVADGNVRTISSGNGSRHYQWGCAHDFCRHRWPADDFTRVLPKSKMGPAFTKKAGAEFFIGENDPFMPIEFAARGLSVGAIDGAPIYRLTTELGSDALRTRKIAKE